MARNKGGRPTKLTAGVTTKLAWAIQMGTTYGQACQYAGIAYSTFRNYVHRGEAEQARLEAGGSDTGAVADRERDFLEFLEALKKAEGLFVVQQLTAIEMASRDHWQAAAWKLERRFPREYGRQMVTISHEDVDVSTMSDEELAAYIARLESGSE